MTLPGWGPCQGWQRKVVLASVILAGGCKAHLPWRESGSKAPPNGVVSRLQGGGQRDLQDSESKPVHGRAWRDLFFSSSEKPSDAGPSNASAPSVLTPPSLEHQTQRVVLPARTDHSPAAISPDPEPAVWRRQPTSPNANGVWTATPSEASAETGWQGEPGPIGSGRSVHGSQYNFDARITETQSGMDADSQRLSAVSQHGGTASSSALPLRSLPPVQETSGLIGRGESLTTPVNFIPSQPEAGSEERRDQPGENFQREPGRARLSDWGNPLGQPEQPANSSDSSAAAQPGEFRAIQRANQPANVTPPVQVDSSRTPGDQPGLPSPAPTNQDRDQPKQAPEPPSGPQQPATPSQPPRLRTRGFKSGAAGQLVEDARSNRGGVLPAQHAVPATDSGRVAPASPPVIHPSELPKSGVGESGPPRVLPDAAGSKPMPAQGIGEAESLPSPATDAGRQATGMAPANGAQPEQPAPSDAPQLDDRRNRFALPAIENSGDWEVTLPVVVDSIQRSYPLLRIALLQNTIAGGENLSAQGAFDLSLKGESLNQPQGYYQNYRHKLSLTQPTFQGGYVLGSYRLGDGFFPTWYGERVTDEGGEFAVGLGGPLLKGRAIDERRTKLLQSQLAQSAVEPNVQAQMLDFVRYGTQFYWVWVASGQAVEAYRELLRLAEQRVLQINQRVEAGDLEQIVRINNEQLIASREMKLIEAERKVQMSAIKLSLFLRSPTGEPLVPSSKQLPKGFPPSWNPSEEQIELDVATALAARPEFIELNLQAEQTSVELAYAENSLLPKLDWVLYTSKDVGAPASPKRDKTPFELEAGIVGEVPLQRRQALGKIESLRGKLSQIQVKREFLANKITAEVQDAVSALRAAYARIERAEANERLATEARQLARIQFEVGDIDLVELNIYEQAVTDAQFQRIAAQVDFFSGEADYRAALAIDPRTVRTTEELSRP